MGYFFTLSKERASTALDISEWGLLAFGLVLVIGIFGEYRKLPHWLMLGPKQVFEILVMIGVAGELLGDGGVFVFSRSLQSFNDKEIAELSAAAEASKAAAKRFESQVADSDARAKSAEAQVATAMAASDEAVAKVSTAEARIAEAQRDAATAQRETAQLKKDAESERLARVKIEDRLADRTLSDEQLKTIASKARSAGQEFEVTPYWDIKESLAIANRIADALIQGGWKYSPPKSPSFLMGGIAGVQIWRHPEADGGTIKAADSLVASLTKEGVTAELRIQNPTNNPKHNKISINVGTKP